MAKTTSIAELRRHLDSAKLRISLEKSTLLNLHPLDKSFNPEEYAFAYIRAERMGMRAINRRLSEIDWLPMKLDPRSEVLDEGRVSMKRWVMNPDIRQPDSDEFGNDFIHVMARSGLQNGWDSPTTIKLMIRVSNLFRDLSCLIGLLYYCTWLEENKIDEAYITDPDDLNRTAEEITVLIQSPEVYHHVCAKELDDDRQLKRRKTLPKSKSKLPPQLRVIENKNYFDPYIPDPATV